MQAHTEPQSCRTETFCSQHANRVWRQTHLKTCSWAKGLTTCMTQTKQGVQHLCTKKQERHQKKTTQDDYQTQRVIKSTESTTVQKNNNKQKSASSARLSCWQRTINYGLPASLSLRLALRVSACLRLYNCTQHATVDLWQRHPRPVLQPAVTQEFLHAVWLSEESVWVTKTGPKAESGPVNCHFLLSASSLRCLPICLFTSWHTYQCASGSESTSTRS